MLLSMATLTHRRRAPAEDDDDANHTLLAMDAPSKHHPTCATLLLSASKHGWLWKRRRPIAAKIFSSLRHRKCCKDAWRERYFVLAGRFLFRFDSDAGAKPKGTPLPVEGCTFRAVRSGEEDDDGDYGGGDGDGGGSTASACGLLVSTVRQEYVLRCSSEEDRDAWLAALASAQHRAIKENMGHASVDPAHRAANEAGSFLFQRRLENDANEAASNRETEMSLLSGAMPRSGLGF